MKRYTLIVVLLLFSIMANAQEQKDSLSNKKNNLSIGIKANIGRSEIYTNWNGVSGDAGELDNYESICNGGIYFNFNLNKRDGINAEILYFQVNGIESTSISNPGVRHDSYSVDHISYLSFPIYYSYRISKFRLGGGFQLGFVLSSSSEGTSTEEIFYPPFNTSTVSSTDKPDVYSYDFGYKLLAFYDLSKKIFIDVDYYHSIINISNISGSSLTPTRNIELSLGLGYCLVNK